MNTKITIGIIAISAFMLVLGTVVASQTFAKQASTCTNGGDQTTSGTCSGNISQNNKCQTTYKGNSINSQIDTQTGSGC